MFQIEVMQSDASAVYDNSDSSYSGSSDSEDDETFTIALGVPHKLKHVNEVQSPNDNHNASTSQDWYQKSEEDTAKKHSKTAEFTFLRPAKLKIDNGTPTYLPLPQPTPICKPSKLKIVNDTKRYVTKNSTNSLYSANYAFARNDHMNNYMKYLQILQSVKKNNVSKQLLPGLTKDKIRCFLRENWKSKKDIVDNAHTGNWTFEEIQSLQSSSLNKSNFAHSYTRSPISSTNHVEMDIESSTLPPNTVPVLENAPPTKEVTNVEVLDLYFLEMLQTLINLFPRIDENYIFNLCETKIKKLQHKDNLQYQDLIDHLIKYSEYVLESDSDLESNVDTEMISEIMSKPEANSIQRQYNFLINMFPNADPIYMKKIAVDMHGDSEIMNHFIERNIDNPSYPTKEQYLEKRRISKLQKQYTSGFTVPAFLRVFPDPFAYFLGSERKCTFSDEAVDFLTNYFSDVHVADIESIYEECNYNLSLSFEEISTEFSSLHPRSAKSLPLPTHVELLQEIAFLEHKDQIADYVAKLKQKERALFIQMKENCQLLECKCCYDKECMPSKVSRCAKGHIFCNDCVIKGTEAQLCNGNAHVPCFTQCDSEFSLVVLQRIMPPQMFSILLKKRQEAEVNAAGLEGLVSCPFCTFASIPPPDDKVFRCLNPECMKESCRNCKALNHLPDKCYAVRKDEARLLLEEKMTEALVRECFKCKRPYFKEEGCNKISCICGATICYVCDVPVDGYNHFAGQGSSDINRCPLFSDDRRLNNEVVRQVAIETVKHIKKKDPKMEVDTSHLLPEPAAATFGPHDYIANANAILNVRVDKVATFKEH